MYANRRRWHEDNNEGTYQAYLRRLVGALGMQIAGVDVERFNGMMNDMIAQHQVRRFKFPRQLMRALAPTHHIVAISGSPKMLVEPFLADLPVDTVYGSEYEIVDDKFTGNATSVGDKAAILRNLQDQGVVTTPESVSIGDTVSDIP